MLHEYSSRYEQIQVLGRSPEDDSELVLVRDSIGGQYRTAKKLSIDEGREDSILNEVSLLKQLDHPHILQYHDIHLQDDQLVSILEFCEEGDVGTYLQRRKQRKENCSQKLILSWLMQLLMGLEYIHNRHIVHRMLAARNVFLNHQGDLKIGSFGSAKQLQDTLKKAMTLVTAPCSMSPEMVQGEPYDGKADIWALGCLLYEMATFKPPYQYASLPQLYDLIVLRPPPELPSAYAKYLTPLYRKMMRKSPSQRPSASELLQQQVFVGLMREYIKKKRIDSLDLKYIVPKRLAIHRPKESPRTKQPLKLPPISPGSKQNNTKSRPTKLEATLNTSPSEIRTHSKQRRKGSREQRDQPAITQQTEQEPTGERLTKINEKQGIHISHLYEAKLAQILLKYKPNMSLICEKTYQFEEVPE